MTESWGRPVKRKKVSFLAKRKDPKKVKVEFYAKKKKKAPALDEIKIGSKWFVLREDGLLVLKSKLVTDKK